jgi:single-strand DNA-binding protein
LGQAWRSPQQHPFQRPQHLYRQWEDKDGNKRNSTEIVATNIVLLGSGRGRDSGAPGDFGGGGGGGGGSSAPPADDFGDDDIPF